MMVCLLVSVRVNQKGTSRVVFDATPFNMKNSIFILFGLVKIRRMPDQRATRDLEILQTLRFFYLYISTVTNHDCL